MLPTDKFTEQLKQQILGKADTEFVDVNINLKPDPVELLQQNAGFVAVDSEARDHQINLVKKQIADSQTEFIKFIRNNARGKITQLWMNNVVGAELPIGLLLEIAKRDDVREIDFNKQIPTTELFDSIGAYPAAATTASYFRTRWHLELMNVYKVWNTGLTGKGVLVAVIDSGINYKHLDLCNQMWNDPRYPKHGINLVDGEDPNDPMDDASGHGTASASIIAGNGNADPNRVPPPPLGLAPGVQLIAIRIGDLNDPVKANTNERKCWEAIEFAVDCRCDVIAMSASMKHDMHPNYRLWRTTCTIAYLKDIIHINSAGNNGDEIHIKGSPHIEPHNVGAPANCPPPWLHPQQLIRFEGGLCSVVTCGATDVKDKLLSSSSRGPCMWNLKPYDDYPYVKGSSGKKGLIKPDISAPGDAIEVCSPIGNFYSPIAHYHTSAAASCVAGAASLLMEAIKTRNPRLPNRAAHIMQALSTPPSGHTGIKEDGPGTGRIDVMYAYEVGQRMRWW